jgi:hypothetical protein
MLIGLILAWASDARELTFRVRDRSADTVYLEGGATAGLAIGDRLGVWRGGERIGEIEVAFVASYSASCKVVEESGVIASDDQARRIADLRAVRKSVAELALGEASPASGQTAGTVPIYTRAPRTRQRQTRISGTLSLDWDSFSDSSAAGLDFDRLSTRLNLRGRDLAGVPLSLRVRARSQKLTRSRDLGRGASESETRDRLYEVSVRYDARNDRFSLIGGRLGASPYVGIGFLDGILGEVRLYKDLSFGAFWGARPNVQELGFDSSGQKYGAYTRLAGARSESLRSYEVVLGGVVEDGDVDVSREYAVLEASYSSAGRWSFFQRAEIDFNNDWREDLADSTVELSNLALSAWARITDTARLVVSYDQFRQYRTEETRFVPEELFDALLRQGLRVGVNFGKPRALSWSVNAGLRDKESGEEASTSFGLGVRHPDIGAGISMRGDVLSFSNEYQEGGVFKVRASRRFGGNHELHLDLGGRMSSSKLLQGSEGDTTDSWGRIGFWSDLPKNLFARGEFEFLSGDNLEGTRVSAGIGYRF